MAMILQALSIVGMWLGGSVFIATIICGALGWTGNREPGDPLEGDQLP